MSGRCMTCARHRAKVASAESGLARAAIRAANYDTPSTQVLGQVAARKAEVAKTRRFAAEHEQECDA